MVKILSSTVVLAIAMVAQAEGLTDYADLFTGTAGETWGQAPGS